MRAKEEIEKLGIETTYEMQEQWSKANAMTEEQLRDAETPRPRTIEELTTYINALVDRPHDYGTSVYAMSLSAVAAFQYVSHKIGVTGFQASCADMKILRHTRDFKWGKILDYEKLLYPQYCDAKHFPDHTALVAEHKDELAKRATELLAKAHDGTHPDVLAHWRRLAAK